MKDFIIRIRESYNSKLMDEVIDIVLDEAENTNEGIKEYLENVMAHGCESGVVKALIYYKDTKAFFLRHFEEIFDIVNENDIEVQELNANELAWIGFEYMVQEFYSMWV